MMPDDLPICPKCGSVNCDLQTTGRKAGVVIGGAAGAAIASSIILARNWARIAAPLVQLVSRQPPTVTLRAMAVVIAGFCCGARLGHGAGTVIDCDVLRLYRCHDCGEEFER